MQVTEIEILIDGQCTSWVPVPGVTWHSKCQGCRFVVVVLFSYNPPPLRMFFFCNPLISWHHYWDVYAKLRPVAPCHPIIQAWGIRPDRTVERSRQIKKRRELNVIACTTKLNIQPTSQQKHKKTSSPSFSLPCKIFFPANKRVVWILGVKLGTMFHTIPENQHGLWKWMVGRPCWN